LVKDWFVNWFIRFVLKVSPIKIINQSSLNFQKKDPLYLIFLSGFATVLNFCYFCIYYIFQYSSLMVQVVFLFSSSMAFQSELVLVLLSLLWQCYCCWYLTILKHNLLVVDTWLTFSILSTRLLNEFQIFFRFKHF
jgi:hypothetical protein